MPEIIKYPKINYIGDYIRAKYLELYMKKGKGKCLDIGCGNMRYGSLVEEKGHEYYGIDPAATPANIQCFLKLKSDSAENLSFKEGEFDCAICIDVLEHLKNPKKAIEEAWRILKLGSYLYLHTPNINQTHILFPHKHQENHIVEGFTEQELHNLFYETGFLKINIIPTFNIFEMLAWEIFHATNKEVSISLEKLLNFKLESYKNGGWLCICQK